MLILKLIHVNQMVHLQQQTITKPMMTQFNDTYMHRQAFMC